MSLLTGGGSGGGATLGRSSLIYRYTVTGSDKASIDTGVDAPQVGSNDWTGGDLLEVWFYYRTDEAVVNSAIDVTLNNDTSAIYDRQTVAGNNVSASAGAGVTQAKWLLNGFGASATAGHFAVTSLVIPNYAGTVGKKFGQGRTDRNETTAAASEVDVHSLGYRSASAVTRLAVIPDTAAKKFVVGSQLLIYKRINA